MCLYISIHWILHNLCCMLFCMYTCGLCRMAMSVCQRGWNLANFFAGKRNGPMLHPSHKCWWWVSLRHMTSCAWLTAAVGDVGCTEKKNKKTTSGFGVKWLCHSLPARSIWCSRGSCLELLAGSHFGSRKAGPLLQRMPAGNARILGVF